jgi:hypothetical protein
MPSGYLVLTSERRLLCVAFDDDVCAVQHTIGSQSVEHGTTFPTEDQLFVDADQDRPPEPCFWVSGVPFPFTGNALLIGINPRNGKIADQPVISLHEFSRLIAVATRTDSVRFMLAVGR